MYRRFGIGIEIALAVVVLWIPSAMGSSLGLKAYDDGDYAAAIEAFEAAIDLQPGNVALYFNLGNAFLRNKQSAHAAAAYLEALRLSPRDPDIIANLATARKGAKDQLVAEVSAPLWTKSFFWIRSLSTLEIAYLATVLSLLFWSILGVWYKRRATAWLQLAFGVMILACVVWASLFVKLSLERPWGVVIPDLAQVYSGPSTSGNKVLFELNTLAPVSVREVRAGWLKIGLSDGKKGWVSSEAIAYFSARDDEPKPMQLLR